MIIRIAADYGVTLEAPEDLKRFKAVVEAPRGDAPRLEAAIAPLGRLDGEAALWVSPDWLRRASGLAGDAAWEAGFTRMCDYAAQHGWVDAAGAIRAHLEWAAPAA